MLFYRRWGCRGLFVGPDLIPVWTLHPRYPNAFLPCHLLSAPKSGTLVAEWIHFTLFGIILPTIKLKV